MLVTFHEQKRILQFNNQNLHDVNIKHIIKSYHMFLSKKQLIINNYIF